MQLFSAMKSQVFAPSLTMRYFHETIAGKIFMYLTAGVVVSKSFCKEQRVTRGLS